MSDSPDYRMAHTAPSDDGYSRPITEVLTRFGPDILDHPDYYGECDDETLIALRRAVADPAATVRIYRAVPPGCLEINDGDWVTLSKGYALNHAWQGDDIDPWPVVSVEVPATQVFSDGNDPSEYGYVGDAHQDLRGLTEGETPAS